MPGNFIPIRGTLQNCHHVYKGQLIRYYRISSSRGQCKETEVAVGTQEDEVACIRTVTAGWSRMGVWQYSTKQTSALMSKGHKKPECDGAHFSPPAGGRRSQRAALPRAVIPPFQVIPASHTIFGDGSLSNLYIYCVFTSVLFLWATFEISEKNLTPPLQILSSPQTLPQTPSGKISAHSEPFSAFYALKAFCTATHDLRHWPDIALADVHAPAFREDCNGRFAWLLSPPYTLHMAAVRAMGPFLPQVTSCSILLHMVVLDSTEWWQQEQFPDAG